MIVSLSLLKPKWFDALMRLPLPAARRRRLVAAMATPASLFALDTITAPTDGGVLCQIVIRPSPLLLEILPDVADMADASPPVAKAGAAA